MALTVYLMINVNLSSHQQKIILSVQIKEAIEAIEYHIKISARWDIILASIVVCAFQGTQFSFFFFPTIF